MGALFGGGGGGVRVSQEAVQRARQLAPGARFNPYTVRTGSGTTGYTGDGQFFSQLSQPYQNVLGTTLGGAQNLFSQFGSFDPSQRATEVFQEQSALLQPEFQRQATDLQSRLFGSGRLGLRLAGESQGLGAGSGMVQPDALGLGQAQQQTLAQLAAGARQQAFGEQAQLGQMASQALQSGLGISQLEQGLMQQGLSAEAARAAAALGAGQLEISPYTAAAEAQAQQGANQAGFFGQLLGAAGSALSNPAVTTALGFPGSDIRLKTNIEHVDTLPNGIKLYTWDWIGDKSYGPTYGVIAQEIVEVIPEAVFPHPEGYLTVNYNHPELKGVH